ncbi:bifunctional diguanylate cyclase/phosphodiesterase [Dactylosporangium sp. AC04546]|uniref:putative bifunctional diguanylate cyclase/phosphodiesterase n=1 Tax=Dactylosporangium sp. AC04546 TaxID=2862460 RepID=UPI001EE1363C|nr:bifunctional diguanylate cyclase/phosphodiesterase [Dactylosporangium sp. AC04546]WVK82691.1 bifunctional diguanylate cyclase/phosphodiesterase [Dactylosporangium sp. AC04546]
MVRIWLWFLTCALAVSAVAAVLSPDGLGGFWLAVQSLCLAAAVAGLRRHRPGPAAAWWLLLSAVAVSAATSLLRTLVPDAPVGVQVGYLLCYPLTAGGLWLIARRVRPWSTTRLLDAAIVAIGGAQVTWALLVYPLLHHAGLGPGTTVGIVVLAACELLVVALVLRLAFAVRPGRAAVLLFGSTAAMVLSDTTFVVTYTLGSNAIADSVTSLGWLAWSALLAAALLQPDVRRVAEPVRPAGPGDDGATPIAGFIALALLGPVVLVADLVLRPGNSWQHALVPAVLTAGLMVAMVLRLGRALQDRVRLQRELAFRAQHDVLTGLANRELFRSSFQDGVDAGGEVGLLLVDLDGFKDVNDTLGHPAGDELLLEATARLRRVAGAHLLARLGGDEFAVICPPAALDTVSAGCVRELARPYDVAGRELRLTASIGMYAGNPASTGEALQCADIALYAAKEAGRNRAVRYHQTLRDSHQAHTALAEQLRAAVASGTGFAVHYQPVVDVHSGRVTAVEALLRFRAPDGTPVSPAVFVPVAEEIGLIGRIGSWVLEQACTDARAWHASHGISVTVNVSGRQLSNPRFADEVLAALQRTGLPGTALVLEITETVLVTASLEETAEVSRRLARLRAFGVRIAIDDFGTGYSSLAYLRTLPIDVLKIDRAFVSRIEERQDKALFRAVVELARSMYLQPVAEGVETTGQASVLRELDCGLAQGFLFARPMPADALSAALTAPAPVSP